MDVCFILKKTTENAIEYENITNNLDILKMHFNQSSVKGSDAAILLESNCNQIPPLELDALVNCKICKKWYKTQKSLRSRLKIKVNMLQSVKNSIKC